MKTKMTTLIAAFAMLFSVQSAAQNVQVVNANFAPLTLTDCVSVTAAVQVLKLCNNIAYQGASVSVGTDTTVLTLSYTLGPICLGALAQVTETEPVGLIPASTSYITVDLDYNGSVVSTASYPVTVTSCCPVVADFSFTNNICPGDSAIFTNTSSSANSYTWYEGTTNLSSSTDFGKVFQQPGVYNISLVASDGSCGDSLTKTLIVVDAIPNLGADVAFCTGDSVLLDAGAGLDSVSWNNGSITARTLYVKQGGTYIAQGFKGACSGVDTIVVTEYALPTLALGADTVICIGDSILLDATQSVTSSYLWSTGDTTATVWVNSANTYSVTVSNDGGCSATDSIAITTDSCDASVGEINVASVSLFPNPASAQLTVLSEDISGSVQLQVLDVNGRVMQTHNIEHWNGKFELQLSAYSNGVYFIQMISQHGASTERFVIQR